MKNLTWQNPEQLFVAQVLINKVKSKCCGIKVFEKIGVFLVRKRRFFRAYQKVGFLSAKISKKTRVKTAKKSEEK
ncbi:MAG: hypothetical protein SO162_07560 [Candidatus Onthomorpha sp.]|nr:hypothetical protein [Candidatus Onthomorpha sp.]